MQNDPFRIEFDEFGQIVDFITGDLLDDRPEERVRQVLQRILHIQHKYPKNLIVREVPIYYGGSMLRDTGGNPVRADVAVYRTEKAAKQRDQGRVYLVCETKRPRRQDGYDQLVSYIFNTSSDGAIWFNGEDIRVFRRIENNLDDWPTLPRFGESWDAVGRRKKSELEDLTDVRSILRICHDRIHRRGTTDDVSLTMARILLAKWRDEERAGDLTEFYCTPAEYKTKDGRRLAAQRAESLFAEVRDANPTVFDAYETIGASSDEIVEAMVEFQKYKLLGDNDQQWDIMGAAYEQYTAEEMKKEGGEFFTNRLVVHLLTKMVSVTSDDIVLDPAGGTGGFCSSALRHARKYIRDNIVSTAAQEHALSNLKNRIFLIDKKPRLVKLAKAAMIVSGNGHRGFIQADSLEPIADLSDEFLRYCPPEQVSVVMTNPPWSGLANGRISDPLILKEFEVAHRWVKKNGKYQPEGELVAGGVPPEYLFVERCISWLAPGGRLAIVLPKGILDNAEPALAVRHYLFKNCIVHAVINCHKNTFQPYTGSRGCLIVAEKKATQNDIRNNEIFMAINRKIGQDSEGVPIYKKDARGLPTDEIDHDLAEIFQSWMSFTDGKLEESEYCFSIDSSSLDGDTLKLNPQFFLPSLNKTLQRIVSLDGNGFTVERLGDRIASRIWKGVRFKREDLEVDTENENTVPYYTPSSIFMRGEGIKYLDLSKCDERRKKTILAHRAKEGEIIITRSGTIGRLALIGRTLRGVVLSDDLIRVWIEDERLRAFVFSFFRSYYGQDQLKRNEYGTVQQHLEPSHVSDVLIPLPEDTNTLQTVMNSVVAALEAKERSVELDDQADRELSDMLQNGDVK
ncbi:N-6 DNA methylase [Candidatus Acetothermia bacterium]|nr:N-6 DNA methylase [Candidatus Acetothermia bacterium]MBI3643106.1 N-6 DNA methylase [Candidatus Acetothermia bacterium]